MDVNNINAVSVNVSVNTAGNSNQPINITNETNVTVINNYGENENEAAVYQPATEDEKADSANYKPDMSKVREMLAESDAKVESFRRLVEGLFNKQAKKSDIVQNWLDNQNGKLKDVLSNLEVDAETAAAAQKEIDEGGYYSVDETAKRLLDFAVAISGGDPSKIDTLRDAVEKGFKQAEQQWGDKLPEISQKTYDAVMNGFDEWNEAGSSDGITLLKAE
jgi:gas vesicle protein